MEREPLLSIVAPGPADPRDVLRPVPFADRTLQKLLQQRREDSPDHQIVTVDAERFTWAELYGRAASMASGLAEMGVGRQDVVCHMGINSPKYVVALFALALIGAIECPVNAGLKGESLRHVLDHSGAKWLIVDGELLDEVALTFAKVEELQTVVVRGDQAVKLEGMHMVRESELIDRVELDPEPVAPEEPGMLMYTSGTTGRAKGVLLPNHFVFTTAAVKTGIWGLGRDDVLFSALPLFHANARFSTLLTAAVLNARAAIVPRFSASRFWEQVRAAGATEVGTVGTVPGILLEATTAQDSAGHRVRMMHGAGGLPLERRREFEERFATRLVVGFAMTETSHVATCSPDDEQRFMGAGRPAPGFEVAILDGNDECLAVGEVGEIAVRPEIPYSMFLEYYRDSAATRDALRNLWFHTGDLGYLDELGCLHWVDRRKDAIRRKGEMISSRDVEAAAAAFPRVAEAAAVGVPAELGEEEILLFVRSDDRSGAVALLDLHTHMVAALPSFAVPRYYELVERLPTSQIHKVDKRALRNRGLSEATWDSSESPGRSRGATS